LLEKTKESIASKWPEVEVWSEAGDISVEDFVDKFMKNVVDKFGSIDYAVNCAGVLGQALRSHEMDTAEFDRINSINYRGCWLSSRAELRQMVKQDLPASDDSGRAPQRGAIVNIASQLGIVGRPAAGKAPICTHLIFDSGVQFLKIFNRALTDKSFSSLLRIQGCGHLDDSMRCNRLFARQYQNQLCLSGRY
jgi:NAD(P)-dependent dehydrogenase (short-subunit alcohol dehydrogenase family)